MPTRIQETVSARTAPVRPNLFPARGRTLPTPRPPSPVHGGARPATPRSPTLRHRAPRLALKPASMPAALVGRAASPRRSRGLCDLHRQIRSMGQEVHVELARSQVLRGRPRCIRVQAEPVSSRSTAGRSAVLRRLRQAMADRRHGRQRTAGEDCEDLVFILADGPVS